VGDPLLLGGLPPPKSGPAKYTFVQNFIKLSAAVHELSRQQKKNSAENNTAVVTAESNKIAMLLMTNNYTLSDCVA